jgi:hypothetical protein
VQGFSCCLCPPPLYTPRRHPITHAHSLRSRPCLSPASSPITHAHSLRSCPCLSPASSPITHAHSLRSRRCLSPASSPITHAHSLRSRRCLSPASSPITHAHHLRSCPCLSPASSPHVRLPLAHPRPPSLRRPARDVGPACAHHRGREQHLQRHQRWRGRHPSHGPVPVQRFPAPGGCVRHGLPPVRPPSLCECQRLGRCGGKRAA